MSPSPPVRTRPWSRLGRLLPIALAATLVAGCAGGGARDSAEATPENPLRLVLAHNLSQQHVTSEALVDFADRVARDTDGRIVVEIHPDGRLGSEREVLEQLQAGVVDMTRVSGPNLATYEGGYHAFGLPFVFRDEEHFYATMDSPQMHEFFLSSQDEGFVGLTWYTSGARSFYTVNRPIRTPSDLRGLRIRVQDMRSQTEMMRALGGTPIVMPFGDIYTGLQTGILDGAESNETALTNSNHGEVTSVFSEDEHAMIPDMLVVSSSAWETLSEADRRLLTEAGRASTEDHKVAWAQEIEEARRTAEEDMGVTFVTDVDRDAFREAVAPMVDEFAAEYDGVRDVLTIIAATDDTEENS